MGRRKRNILPSITKSQVFEKHQIHTGKSEGSDTVATIQLFLASSSFCSCLCAQTDKPEYKRYESGEIEANSFSLHVRKNERELVIEKRKKKKGKRKKEKKAREREKEK
jgi:hypothetical protein